MEKTWRWFGANDSITLDMLKQIGVEGIVSALHEVPTGEVWSYDAIINYKYRIDSAGLRWSVVESLPVSEEIKYGGALRETHIANYIESLRNLGRAGVKTVCYNFMPVIDWIRTDLNYLMPDGTTTLYFDKIKFAYFDLKILCREGAEKDYTTDELKKVEEWDACITQADKDNLIHTIIVKTQGFVNGNIQDSDSHPVNKFKKLLDNYIGIDKSRLRENLKYFLEQIMPVCEKYDIDMCIHPDDPPYPVLGLPRIVGSEEDIDWLLSSVDNPHNGLTFCAGSLSSGIHNNVPHLAHKFLSRTRFVHLRSTTVDAGTGNFMEASHLSGRGELVQLVKLYENNAPHLPMRVDHGKLMLDDKTKDYNPGYSFLGRMYALAQVSGIMAASK